MKIIKAGRFTRKPRSRRDLEAPGRLASEKIKVIAEVELSKADYDALAADLLNDRDFIHEHTDDSGVEHGVMRCILVTVEGQTEALAIEPDGYDYPRYTALVEVKR